MTSAMCARAGSDSPEATLGRAPAERLRIESRPRRIATKAATPDRDGAKQQEGVPCPS